MKQKNTNALQSKVLALNAARVSVATVVTSLLMVVPQVHFCYEQAASIRVPLVMKQTVMKMEVGGVMQSNAAIVSVLT